MPISKLEKPNFIYIAYRRGGFKDFTDFRATLEEAIRQTSGLRDIIIDLTKDDYLTDGEVTLITDVAKRLQSSSHQVRIVATGAVKRRLTSSGGMSDIKNATVYENHEALRESLKAAAEPATPESSAAGTTAAAPPPVTPPVV
jgi:MFS superfamily sulfate permease-like transporter